VLIRRAQARLDDANSTWCSTRSNYAERNQVEVDPLATIVQRMQARGADSTCRSSRCCADAARGMLE